MASKAINIPNSVGFIGEGAFSYIFGVEQFAVGAQNPVYATIDGVLFNKKEKALIAFPCDKQGTGDEENYTFPDGITTIADYACYGFNYRASSISFSHTDIRYVVFPETITSMSSALVADLLGHSDTRMVETVYARRRQEGILKHRQEVESLNAFR